MENIGKDQLFLLAIGLDLPDLLNFCGSSKRINDLICKRNDIWYYKLKKEFPELKYTNKSPRSYYTKVKEIMKYHPELKNILSLIDIEKYENLKTQPIVYMVENLLNVLDKNVLLKIINDYNNHKIYGNAEQITDFLDAEQITDFLKESGLVRPSEIKKYYNFLIKELEIYMKDPSYVFDPSLWEIGNMQDLNERLEKLQKQK